MSYKYKSKDGLAQSNDKNAIATWDSIGEKVASEEATWIATLRSLGIKAAHPDDGWVDREENYVVFAYPYFNDEPQVGDLIVLGYLFNNGNRVVQVTKKRVRGVLSSVTRYYFKELSSGI